MSDYLQHYGIPNQRWGIRRYQNPDGSLTPAGKLRYLRSNSTTLRNPFTKKLHSVEGPFQVNDQDSVMPKGTKLVRFQTGSKIKDGKPYYVQLNDNGIKKYLSNSSQHFKRDVGGVHNPKKDTHVLTMTTKDDIKIPSDYKVYSSFLKTIGTLKTSEVTKGMTKQDKKAVEDYINKISKQKWNIDDERRSRDEAYKAFSNNLGKSTKAREVFLKDLRQKGYNAIRDESKLAANRNSLMLIGEKKLVDIASDTKFDERDKTSTYFDDVQYTSSENKVDDRRLRKKYADQRIKWKHLDGETDAGSKIKKVRKRRWYESGVYGK